MKKIALIVACLVVGFTSVAQVSELDVLANDMFEKTNQRDFDALMDMTYPAVFDLVPKDMMVTMFKSMFEGTDDMSIDLPEQTPEYTLTDTFKSEDSKTEYAFMNYDMEMSMTFKNQEFDKDGQEMMVNMMKVQGMDASFQNPSKVNVNAPDRLVIFLKDEKTNGEWKMVNYDPNSPLFVQILPVEIIEMAKSHHQAIMLESKKKN
ncbi:MAG: hypothetical protein HRU26_09445 [Psychroserpens sp.]|nr:hypothetical protein [Psychroserpens sp.]